MFWYGTLLQNLTAMVQIGSVGGAIMAFYLTDKLGRLWATRQLCTLWIIGIVIFLTASTNGSIGQMAALGEGSQRNSPDKVFRLSVFIIQSSYTCFVFILPSRLSYAVLPTRHL